MYLCYRCLGRFIFPCYVFKFLHVWIALLLSICAFAVSSHSVLSTLGSTLTYIICHEKISLPFIIWYILHHYVLPGYPFILQNTKWLTIGRLNITKFCDPFATSHSAKVIRPWPNYFFCGLGHAFELREVDVWSRYAYPEDLSMAEAAATEMALSWEAHVVNLKEAPVLRIAVLSLMGNLHTWSGNYSEISKQASPPVVSFGKCFSMFFPLCSLSWGRGTASTMCSSGGRFE